MCYWHINFNKHVNEKIASMQTPLHVIYVWNGHVGVVVDWLESLTIFHQCVISYTCSQSYSDGSVLRTLKQSHQSKTGYKYMIWHIDEKLF